MAFHWTWIPLQPKILSAPSFVEIGTVVWRRKCEKFTDRRITDNIRSEKLIGAFRNISTNNIIVVRNPQNKWTYPVVHFTFPAMDKTTEKWNSLQTYIRGSFKKYVDFCHYFFSRCHIKLRFGTHIWTTNSADLKEKFSNWTSYSRK